MNRLGFILLILLAAMLPFEAEQAWLTMGPIAFTNIEIILFALLSCCLWQWQAWLGAIKQIPTSWLLLWGLFITAATIAAWQAPELQLNAFKATWRTFTGICLTTAVLLFIRTPQQRRQLILALLLTTTFSVTIGLAEAIDGQPIQWIGSVRAVPTFLGPFLRLSGTFDYANQAAMVIEAILPLALALTIYTIQHHQYSQANGRIYLFMLIGALIIMSEAIFFTLSRIGFLIIILSHTIIGLGAWYKQKHTLSRYWFAFASSILLFLLLHLTFSPTLRLRLINRDNQLWYQADIAPPTTIETKIGETISVPVSLTNQGAFTWQTTPPYPVNLAVRWQQGQELWHGPVRRPLPKTISPGETVTFHVDLNAPLPNGRYQLIWDLVHEQHSWFGVHNQTEIVTQVTITGTLSNTTTTLTTTPLVFSRERQAWEYAAPIPGRLTLWQIAGQRLQESPWWGIGLDNFRLSYGRYLNQKSWNNTVHTNNWYIESLVSLGLIGTFPFFLWLLLLTYDTVSRITWRQPNLWQMALATSLWAYLLHGFVDYFLLFNATGLLFWLLVGMWLLEATLNDNSDRL